MYLGQTAKLVSKEIEALTGEVLDEDLLSLYALLVHLKGSNATSADVHDCWVTWCSKVDPKHEALVPFAMLDKETQAKDLPYLTAIQNVATSLSK